MPWITVSSFTLNHALSGIHRCVPPCPSLPGTGVVSMVWWMALAFLLPAIFSVMVIGRTFAVFPDAWVWIENLCDEIAMSMREPAHEGFFSFGPRGVAEFSGQDLGVFRTFHPGLDPATDAIPKADTSTVYYMISSTLMYEFVLETLPQIIIQVVNNSLRDDWNTFGYLSVSVSAFIAVDALYRQFVKVCIFGIPFGSPETFNMDSNSDFSEASKEPRVDSNKITLMRKARLGALTGDLSGFARNDSFHRKISGRQAVRTDFVGSNQLAVTKQPAAQSIAEARPLPVPPIGHLTASAQPEASKKEPNGGSFGFDPHNTPSPSFPSKIGQIVVSGAGTRKANGVYSAAGKEDGATCYENENGCQIRCQQAGSSWRIGDWSSGMDWYYKAAGCASTPPLTGWGADMDGATPAPNVTHGTTDKRMSGTAAASTSNVFVGFGESGETTCCSACGNDKASSEFSHNQLVNKPSSTRRCKSCVTIGAQSAAAGGGSFSQMPNTGGGNGEPSAEPEPNADFGGFGDDLPPAYHGR